MTRALVTQLVEALEYAFTGNRRPEILGAAITAARAYLETEPSGERAELIARLAKQWAELDPADPYRADVGQAVDMLEADAQQAKQVPMTTEQITRAWESVKGTSFGYAPFARTIEAHHGIGGEA